MKDENVGEATRRAAREEEERRKRISEKQKLYNEIYKEVEGIETFDKLVLDFNPETKEELVSVDPYIVSKLKPHQVNLNMLFCNRETHFYSDILFLIWKIRKHFMKNILYYSLPDVNLL
jgi:hypothetical protein